MSSGTPYVNSLQHYPAGQIFAPEKFSFSRAKMPEALRRNLLSEMQASQKTDATIGKSEVLKNIRAAKHCQIPQELRIQVQDFLTSYLNSQEFMKFPLAPCGGYTFVEYSSEDKGHYIWHSDNGHLASNGQFSGNYLERIVSLVYYVNSDFQGGELELKMPPLGNSLLLKPQEDYCLLFGADTRFPHRVLPVTSGKRYTVINWFQVTKPRTS